MTKVDRRAIAALLARIGAANGPIAANNVRRDLSAFFAWCCREGLIDANPAAHTNKFASRSRSRLLTDPEIKAIWLATADGGDAYCSIIRLLLLTGARRSEIGGLRWSEFVDELSISLPPERTKNGAAHVIPLPAAAVDIIKAQPCEGDHVFAGERGGEFKTWSRNKERLDERSGVTNWTVHDFRRFFSTSLHERLGVAPHICESLLGHHQGGVASVYNRSAYLNEKRVTLARWADFLVRVAEGHGDGESKVLAFAGRPQ